MKSASPAAALRRAFAISVLVAVAGAPALAKGSPETVAPTYADGVLRVRSSHSVNETVARIRAAVEAKGIRHFAEIDQRQLGAGAGLPIRASVLVLFGNPPLGVQFLQANPYAGLDWPVRMLVREAEDGGTEIAWTDFAFIGRRYAIGGKRAQLKMANEVAATIA
ncbi:DUF302 domain-containing protein [Sphingomonas ginkgonis]|uniref:DUF302 domain-containing protein n=1 Tax=Sphingomonas ginkgonis TaxID=2315330 RepID=A0A429VBK8_9SPHN|nr:DUF302 domain-containing protein [Sphingomonas ginkgonis]RST31266.1 DUF302 domain-containing protein [Sphingomonas ginkgonis]